MADIFVVLLNWAIFLLFLMLTAAWGLFPYFADGETEAQRGGLLG